MSKPPEMPEWGWELIRDVSPLVWARQPGMDGVRFMRLTQHLSVIVTASTERDNRRWLHVSVSRPHKLPSWDDLKEVKDTFIGEGRKAVQVLPPKSEYVNIHPYVLHLWHCVDGDGLPDFTRGSASL